ncbi:MAG: GNAT family N-acetyltransferase [Erythrobacter sp.]|uniref:GNAT family N-acetyltransferase n=1 Tax=Erythrobacter sp. TaxID=1042 RepID=UPI001B0B644B|nr:GNAT family N-acetyltransferase [Erythrobacter sp.]MBO6768083.1 GNAT family N-acetyltransferase [Erythrobacter sp.]
MIQHAASTSRIAIPTLTTPRFVMRPLRRTDAAALLPTLGEEAQCRYLSRAAFTSQEELWNWLADPDWNGRTWIAEDADGTVVGRFVAVPDEEEGVEEIGYITCAEWQGVGVARECSAALIANLFDTEGARRLVAEVDIENLPSVRLLERLGFARTALHPAHEETHKGVCDIAFYALDRDRYRAERELDTHD